MLIQAKGAAKVIKMDPKRIPKASRMASKIRPTRWSNQKLIQVAFMLKSTVPNIHTCSTPIPYIYQFNKCTQLHFIQIHASFVHNYSISIDGMVRNRKSAFQNFQDNSKLQHSVSHISKIIENVGDLYFQYFQNRNN